MVNIKFSDDIIKDLLIARENGMSRSTCAGICNIDAKTLYNWIKKGKEAKSGKYHDFYLRWCYASAKYKYFHHTKISKADDWRASRYLLEVEDPDYYVVQNKVSADVRSRSVVESEFDEELFDKILKEEYGKD